MSEIHRQLAEQEKVRQREALKKRIQEKVQKEIEEKKKEEEEEKAKKEKLAQFMESFNRQLAEQKREFLKKQKLKRIEEKKAKAAAKKAAAALDSAIQNADRPVSEGNVDANEEKEDSDDDEIDEEKLRESNLHVISSARENYENPIDNFEFEDFIEKSLTQLYSKLEAPPKEEDEDELKLSPLQANQISPELKNKQHTGGPPKVKHPSILDHLPELVKNTPYFQHYMKNRELLEHHISKHRLELPYQQHAHGQPSVPKSKLPTEDKKEAFSSVNNDEKKGNNDKKVSKAKKALYEAQQKAVEQPSPTRVIKHKKQEEQ